MMAVREGMPPTVDLLLRQGRRRQHRNENGATALGMGQARRRVAMRSSARCGARGAKD